MKKLFALLFLLIGSVPAFPRLNIIFETDMGNDADDALTLDMLYKWHDQRDIKLLAVMLNKSGDYPVKYIDLMNTWYGYGKLPIGRLGGPNAGLEPWTAYTETLVNMKDEDGNPVYERTVEDINELPLAPELYRKLLSKVKDHSVSIVSVGFSTNLALLLDTKPDKYSKLSGMELVAKKVKNLVVTAAHLEDPNFIEFNIKGDIPAARKVYDKWPTPIITSPYNLGIHIGYPGTHMKSLERSEHMPLVDSYHDYHKDWGGQPSWDLTAALYAVDPQDMFGMTKAGRMTIEADGRSKFTEMPGGLHYCLTTTQEQREKIVRYYCEIIGKKPKHAKTKR